MTMTDLDRHRYDHATFGPACDNTETGQLIRIAIGLAPWWENPALTRLELHAFIDLVFAERYGPDVLIDPRPPELLTTRPYRKTRIPAALRAQVYDRDGHRCLDCGTSHNLACDHVHPEIHGGPTTLDNLATRCRSCNSRKGTKVAQ